jgi:hypothetical protein
MIRLLFTILILHIFNRIQDLIGFKKQESRVPSLVAFRFCSWTNPDLGVSISIVLFRWTKMLYTLNCTMYFDQIEYLHMSD